MKTTKKLLLDIYGQDSCSEFNNAIKELLIENFIAREETEFTIPKKYLDRLGECSKAQLALLDSIGINNNKWSRTMLNPDKQEYFFLERNMKTGYKPSKMYDEHDANLNFVFFSEQQAQNEAKIYNLIMLMRSWANFHNKLDGFIPDWYNPNKRKCGLSVGDGAITTTSRYLDMELFFHIAVASDQRARELRDEFKQDILEIIKYL